MNTQKHVVDGDYKKKPEQLKMNLFDSEKDIYVIVRSNKNGIEQLVYASTNKDEAIDRLNELRLYYNSSSVFIEAQDNSKPLSSFDIMAFRDNKFEKTSI
jgi:hypothetical protein